MPNTDKNTDEKFAAWWAQENESISKPATVAEMLAAS